MITSPIQDDNEPQIVNAAIEAIDAQAAKATDEVTYVDVSDDISDTDAASAENLNDDFSDTEVGEYVDDETSVQPDTQAELEAVEDSVEVAVAIEDDTFANDFASSPVGSYDTTSDSAENESIDTASVTANASQEGELDEQSQAVTAPFVGQWNTLVSQTNWEKGRIISDWREALISSGAHVTVYSDETWSKQVGGVTSQHVGRLRRVHERFGATQKTYERLYWSHFLAALDWDDAELWLEGAVASSWSVSKMRKMRWESSGANPENTPRDEDVVASEVDGDFDQLVEQPEVESDREDKDRIGTTGPLNEGPDFGDADEDHLSSDSEGGTAIQAQDAPWDESEGTSDLGNPFAGLPNLPPDVAEALEQFKLSIVRHRSSMWADISQKTMLDVVNALQQFALR